jgi:hypothetical protein
LFFTGTQKNGIIGRFYDDFGRFVGISAIFGPILSAKKIYFKFRDCQTRETNFERWAPQCQLTR